MLRSSTAGVATEVSKLLSGWIVRGLVASPSSQGLVAGASQAGVDLTNAESYSVAFGDTTTSLVQACEGDDAEINGNGFEAAYPHLHVGTLPAGKADFGNVSGLDIRSRFWPSFQSAVISSSTTSAWQADTLFRQHSMSVHSSALWLKDAGVGMDGSSTQGQVSEGSSSASPSRQVEVARQILGSVFDAPDGVGAEAASSRETASSESKRSVPDFEEVRSGSQEVDKKVISSNGSFWTAGEDFEGEESQEEDSSNAAVTGKMQTEDAGNLAREQMCTVTIVAKAFEPEMVEYFQDSMLADWVDEEEPVDALGEGPGAGSQALLNGRRESDVTSATPSTSSPPKTKARAVSAILPTHKRRFTVLRGPHIDKKSREQFEINVHKRLVKVRVTMRELPLLVNWLKEQAFIGVQLGVTVQYQTPLSVPEQ